MLCTIQDGPKITAPTGQITAPRMGAGRTCIHHCGAEPACLREAGACYGGARRLVHGVLLADQFALQGL